MASPLPHQPPPLSPATMTSAATAANTNEDDDNSDGGEQQQQLQLQPGSCQCRRRRRSTASNLTALSRVTTSKREGGRTRCAHSVFYVCFLLTSYYRRRGIPSISMPGALSPSFTPILTPRPSLSLDHSRFDMVKRVIPSSSRRNNDKQLEARGRAYKVRPQCFLHLFFTN